MSENDERLPDDAAADQTADDAAEPGDGAQDEMPFASGGGPEED